VGEREDERKNEDGVGYIRSWWGKEREREKKSWIKGNERRNEELVG
jgi:hypothetical protein